MPKVICTLDNASELINGVRFVTHALGMISEEIEAEVVEHFCSIPGYKLAETKPPADPEKDALLARAAELGIRAKGSWGVDRLKTEIKAVEDEQAAAAAAAQQQSTPPTGDASSGATQ